MARSFRELEVWKSGRKLKIRISELVRKFPKSEDYSLTSQIRNSSRSITACIAEGHGRFHFQENIQFCRVSRGSLDETLDHLITALDENYITEEELKECEALYETTIKLLNGYINYLKNQKDKDL
ncbi:MAG: four helix bundle protein [Chitinophagales bacterium]